MTDLEPVDHIVVEKRTRQMTLYRRGKVVKSYRVAIGRGGPVQKQRAGDNRTPEGRYSIDWRNEKSRYHLSLHISYPGDRDFRHARANGIDPGGDIMIHGLRNGFGWFGALHRLFNWTQGCVAVTNREIREIWKLVPDGTSIEIKP